MADARGLDLGAPRLPAGRSLARHVEGVEPIARLLAVVTDVIVSVAGPAPVRPARDAVAAAVVAIYDDTTIDLARDRLVRARLLDVEKTLTKRRGLLGNPLVGLTLHHGLVAVDARALVDVASVLVAGVEISDTQLFDRRRRLVDERRALVAGIAGLSAVRAPIDKDSVDDAVVWQLKNLGLPRKETVQLLDLVRAVPTAEELFVLTPTTARGFVFRQLTLAALIDGRLTPDERRFLAIAGEALGVPGAQRSRVRRRVLEVVRRHREDFNAVDLAAGFAAARVPLEERFARAIIDNADALWREVRETGDLGVLLARRAAGSRLTDDEQHRMWEQLKDVMRAVPSLAVFVLPGGFVLLPLLLRVLPFDLRPSSFRDDDVHTFATGEDDKLSTEQRARHEARALAPPSFWRRR